MNRQLVKAPVRLHVKLAIGALLVALLTVMFGLATLMVCWVRYPFPSARLSRCTSVELTDRQGREIASLVAPDDTWCRPVPLEDVSPWLVKATVAVEDKRFFDHPGIDPLAVARAASGNLKSGRIVSGASTLSMQVCRMMDDRSRTFRAKAVESLRALQLEQRYDKDEILELYLTMAPYGRNFKGVEAASRGWFGKSASQLSLAEAALLAGLPQSPSRYRLDLYPERAAARRRVVLARMLALGMIDHRQHDLAAAAPVTIVPAQPMNTEATGFVYEALARRSTGGRTTLDLTLQRTVRELTRHHLDELPAGTRCAVVIVDLSDGAVRAMVNLGGTDDDRYVNTATAWRSPGSSLKPWVYLAAFQDGRLSPDSAVYDVPMNRDGWQPENFDHRWHGKLSAARALRLSLNVPALRVTEAVGLVRSVGVMQSAGIRFRGDPATRAGLTVAVGGAEVRLVDLVQAWATLGRDGRRVELRYYEDAPVREVDSLEETSCRAVSHVLSCRHRRARGLDEVPEAEMPWFAWKTGTSSGRRDAWAAGHNRRFAVGVWVGRTRGTGHTRYVGAVAAEPLLARLFCLESIRLDVDPPRPADIAVTRPIAPPRRGGPAILQPADGAVFTAMSGRAVIHTRLTEAADALTWFLNDTPIDGPLPGRLSLGPGRYRLRGVDGSGQVVAVGFAVR